MPKTLPADIVLKIAPVLARLSRKLAGSRHDQRDDYYQEGALGACLAVSHFDSNKGRLEAYAECCARGRMLNRLRSMKYRSREISAGSFCETDSDQPQDATAEAARSKLVDDFSQTRLLDKIDANTVWRLAPLILTPKELRAIHLVYSEGRSLHEAASSMGVSSPRIVQLTFVALAKLRVQLTRPSTLGQNNFPIRGLRHAGDGPNQSARPTVAQTWVQKGKRNETKSKT